ncbi:MAG: alpha-L-fucosidase, partial [Prevotellaceae bacterium]|nr:alpha-L-fucosidase [Prevotellaceae bacterium]
LLVRAAGYGGNLLLNVGPMPNGKIQPECVDRLAQMGEWTGKYGETIYGTKGGFIRPQPWGAITQKEKTYYVHILNREGEELALDFPVKIKSARWLNSDQKAEWKQDSKTNRTTFKLNVPAEEIDTILEVTAK